MKLYYVIPSGVEGCFASFHFHIPPKSPFAKGGLGCVASVINTPTMSSRAKSKDDIVFHLTE